MGWMEYYFRVRAGLNEKLVQCLLDLYGLDLSRLGLELTGG